MAESNENQVNEPAPEIVAEAKELGWVPQEEFRGSADKWIDAPTFLARGRDVMPLLRKNNERLRGELQQDRKELQKLRDQVAAGQESVQELMKFHKDNVQKQVAEARAKLLEEVKVAREAQDIGAETDALGELSQLDAKIAVDAAALPKGGNGADPGGEDVRRAPTEPAAWFTAWAAKNPWLDTDKRKTRMANVISAEMRADPQYAHLTGVEFLDRVVMETEKTLGGSGGRGDSRFESGNHSGSLDMSSGKGFSALPREAQEAARQQAKKMVGEGRAFKTEKEWFNYYAENF